jgi:hypothetical protein
MKVYILTKYNYEWQDILDVFSSKENAISFLYQYIIENSRVNISVPSFHNKLMRYRIIEKEVDE